MSARRDVTSGAAFALGVVVVGGVALALGWRWLAPQIVGVAGAAGAAAGEEASHQVTTGVQGAAPSIGAEVGRGAVEGATAKAGEILGSPSDNTFGGPVTYGGVPVEVT